MGGILLFLLFLGVIAMFGFLKARGNHGRAVQIRSEDL
jgi:hypothetical protein